MTHESAEVEGGFFQRRHSIRRSPEEERRERKSKRRREETYVNEGDIYQKPEEEQGQEEVKEGAGREKEEEKKEEEEIIAKWKSEEKDIQGKIQGVMEAIEQIRAATSRESGTGNSAKLTFNRAEQQIVRKALNYVNEELASIITETIKEWKTLKMEVKGGTKEGRSGEKSKRRRTRRECRGRIDNE